MRRWRAIQLEVFPESMWEFCPNGETTTDVIVSELFEDGIWDLVGCDRYNQNPYMGKNYQGAYKAWSDVAYRGTDDNPIGAERWRLFAEKRGLPLCFPEYGNNAKDTSNPGNAGDDPYWITTMLDWMQTHGGRGAGQVLFDSWFNQVGKEEEKWPIYRTDGVAIRGPKTAAAYQAWFKAKG